jgi:hypothetical protein
VGDATTAVRVRVAPPAEVAVEAPLAPASLATRLDSVRALLREDGPAASRAGTPSAATRAWLRSVPSLLEDVARRCCRLVECCGRAIERNRGGLR